MNKTNLQGKIVCYHVSENERQAMNNGQETCPAIVVTDWSPNGENHESKTINLKVLFDGPHDSWRTSVQHISKTFTPAGEEPNRHQMKWSFYPEAD